MSGKNEIKEIQLEQNWKTVEGNLVEAKSNLEKLNDNILGLEVINHSIADYQFLISNSGDSENENRGTLLTVISADLVSRISELQTDYTQARASLESILENGRLANQ